MSKQVELPLAARTPDRHCCELCGRPARVGKTTYHLREVVIDGVKKDACIPCAKARKK